MWSVTERGAKREAWAFAILMVALLAPGIFAAISYGETSLVFPWILLFLAGWLGLSGVFLAFLLGTILVVRLVTGLRNVHRHPSGE